MADGRDGLVASASSDGAIVLPRAATAALCLVDARVAWVPPREVSGLVKLLDRQREQHACGHLKRVHKGLRPPPSEAEGENITLAILLRIGGGDDAEALAADLRAHLAGCAAQLGTVRVPAHAPLTRQQFDEANRVWPVHFHEAAAKRNLAVWSDVPSEAELPAMREHMRSAIAAAQRNAAAGGRPVAAVIARRTDAAGSLEAVATCADATRPMAAGGGAAGGAGGGAWHPLGHAVMRCIEEVARREREQAARKRHAAGQAADDAADGAAGASEAADGAPSAAGGGRGESDHLCSACEVYVTHEPCVMSAMALVHSRVRRVVYALPSPVGGALGSRYELHCEKSLNHHFTVVSGLLGEEALAAGLGSAEEAECGG